MNGAKLSSDSAKHGCAACKRILADAKDAAMRCIIGCGCICVLLGGAMGCLVCMPVGEERGVVFLIVAAVLILYTRASFPHPT